MSCYLSAANAIQIREGLFSLHLSTSQAKLIGGPVAGEVATYPFGFRISASFFKLFAPAEQGVHDKRGCYFLLIEEALHHSLHTGSSSFKILLEK